MGKDASHRMISQEYSTILIQKWVGQKTHIYLTVTDISSGGKYTKIHLYSTTSLVLYRSTGVQMADPCIMVMAWDGSDCHVTVIYSSQKIFVIDVILGAQLERLDNVGKSLLPVTPSRCYKITWNGWGKHNAEYTWAPL
jgi:hypothetical protein